MTLRGWSVVAAAAVLIGALAGCGGDEGRPAPGPTAAPAKPSAPAPAEPAAPAAPPPAAGETGAAIYAARCATCHGADGDGRGAAAVGLTPSPRDFRDPAWQASVSDARIEQVIAQGGPSVGLSPLMPPHPDLAADRARLQAVRAHVRSLRR